MKWALIVFLFIGAALGACGTKTAIGPVFSCDRLDAHVVNKHRQYRFDTALKASGGAKIIGYTYNFGDGSAPLPLDYADAWSVFHTYKDPGPYTASVLVRFSTPHGVQTVSSDSCVARLTVR